jgi:hypothetical protein
MRRPWFKSDRLGSRNKTVQRVDESQGRISVHHPIDDRRRPTRALDYYGIAEGKGAAAHICQHELAHATSGFELVQLRRDLGQRLAIDLADNGNDQVPVRERHRGDIDVAPLMPLSLNEASIDGGVAHEALGYDFQHQVRNSVIGAPRTALIEAPLQCQKCIRIGGAKQRDRSRLVTASGKTGGRHTLHGR